MAEVGKCVSGCRARTQSTVRKIRTFECARRAMLGLTFLYCCIIILAERESAASMRARAHSLSYAKRYCFAICANIGDTYDRWRATSEGGILFADYGEKN